MLDAGTWPTNMTYSPCSAADINPIIRTDIDLRKAFTDVINNRFLIMQKLIFFVISAFRLKLALFLPPFFRTEMANHSHKLR